MGNLQWNDLDQEWIQLLEELVESDITKEEFRAFLDNKKAEKV
ncbi:anti-repressor SinI family protein [Bacillus benzoevorans]|uniref:Sin domain-containing protein n=1 Tax=Bacillus benzoevorans TaxID=1456 RepID=A0A7X0HW51_9BACI|nr:anti-repressor SinI family protein [Bacillus benzoevorans]MBB6447964.1 hypothetical protein [Bacillus benzoevorans]